MNKWCLPHLFFHLFFHLQIDSVPEVLWPSPHGIELMDVLAMAPLEAITVIAGLTAAKMFCTPVPDQGGKCFASV